MTNDKQEVQLLREQLAAAQNQLGTLINRSLDAVITIDQSGIVLQWNPQAVSIFGWSEADAVGSDLSNLIIPPELQEAHSAGLSRFLSTREARILNQRVELEAITKDKRRVAVELTILAHENGNDLQFTAFVRDISEQKRSLRKILDRESQIAALMHSTAEGIYGLDLEGNCTFSNISCARMLGYGAPDELLGRNMHSLIHHTRSDGTAYPNHECHIYKSFRVGQGVHIEGEVFWRKDGTSFPTEYWSHPVKVGDELIGSVVTFLDITERKQLEAVQWGIRDELEGVVGQRTADLAATRARLELALRGGNVGLWDWNAETDEVYYSDTFKHQLGFAADTPRNHFRDWEMQLHVDDRDAALARVHEYFANPVSDYESTFRMQRKDGTFRWILARGKAQFDDRNRPLRMVGVHIDVTQRKQDERELKRLNDALATANDALQQSNVELQQFAYVASHDLQTPLRAIAGFAQFLHSDYEADLDERAVGYIDRIVNAKVRKDVPAPLTKWLNSDNSRRDAIRRESCWLRRNRRRCEFRS